MPVTLNVGLPLTGASGSRSTSLQLEPEVDADIQADPPRQAVQAYPRNRTATVEDGGGRTGAAWRRQRGDRRRRGSDGRNRACRTGAAWRSDGR